MYNRMKVESIRTHLKSVFLFVFFLKERWQRRKSVPSGDEREKLWISYWNIGYLLLLL